MLLECAKREAVGNGGMLELWSRETAFLMRVRGIPRGRENGGGHVESCDMTYWEWRGSHAGQSSHTGLKQPAWWGVGGGGESMSVS